MKHLFIFIGAFFHLLVSLNCQTRSVYIGYDNLPAIAEKYKIDIFELKSSYFQYLYLIEKNVLLKKQKIRLKDLPEKANLTFELGEIDALTRDKLVLGFLQLERETNECTFEIAITENQIKKLLNCSDNIIPETDTLLTYMSAEVIEFIQNHMASRPDSSIEIFLTAENHILQFEKAESAYKFYTENLLPYAFKIERNALLMLQNEEIDKIFYYELLYSSFQIQIEFLQVVNEYNKTVLQIEKNYANE